MQRLYFQSRAQKIFPGQISSIVSFLRRFPRAGSRRYDTDPSAAYQNMNLGRQNHMCTLATVKDSWFRRIMVRLCLGVVNLAASRIYILGALDTMTTIHFARWALFDDNKRVLFLSN